MYAIRSRILLDCQFVNIIYSIWMNDVVETWILNLSLSLPPTLVSHSHTYTIRFPRYEKKKKLYLPLRKFVRQFRSRRIHHRNHLIIYAILCVGESIFKELQWFIHAFWSCARFQGDYTWIGCLKLILTVLFLLFLAGLKLWRPIM